MTTGRHVVRDTLCKQCNEVVGWKYDKAYEASEKYKVRKDAYALLIEMLILSRKVDTFSRANCCALCHEVEANDLGV